MEPGAGAAEPPSAPDLRDLDGADPTAGEDRAARRLRLAAHLHHLAAREFAGHAPLYRRIAEGLADDPGLLDRLLDVAPAEKVIPVLLNAAVHADVLAEPDLLLARIYRGEDDADPWPAYRAHVVERFDHLAAVMRRRSVQTNEVGRAAALLPTLRRVHAEAERPLALVELGPSAGLNLLLDRFAYRYDDDPIVGDPSSPVVVSCRLVGPVRPPIGPPPPVAHREGIDLAPVDVLDDEAVRWLEACLWPGLDERAARLRAAVALARTDPPTLHTGDALDLLPDRLGALGDDVVPVVVSTWVLAYLDKADRHGLLALLDGIGARRDLALVTVEYPGIAPWVPVPATPPALGPDTGASLLGLTDWRDGTRRAEPLAWVQAHGQWLEWLAPTPPFR